jgi:hypothetical protein
MAFTDKVQNSMGELVYLVRGKDAGRAAWHYVLIDKMKLPLFKQKLKSGSLDVSEYGKILYSGWGENPPEEIMEEIKKQYS